MISFLDGVGLRETGPASFDHLPCWRQQNGNGVPERFPVFSRRISFVEHLTWLAIRLTVRMTSNTSNTWNSSKNHVSHIGNCSETAPPAMSYTLTNRQKWLNQLHPTWSYNIWDFGFPRRLQVGRFCRCIATVPRVTRSISADGHTGTSPLVDVSVAISKTRFLAFKLDNKS